MPSYLFFQLAGPMASWGEIAVGEDRGSASLPTRSAIIGILASALGTRRCEEERQRHLAAGYRTAVIVCDPGELLRDYHTTQVPSSTDAKGWPLATRRDEVDVIGWSRRTKGKAGEAILSYRDYRCDGRWIVAVEARPDAPYSLDELRLALREPKLVLYLGRKSCPPTLPLDPHVIEGENLLEALKGLTVRKPQDLSGPPRGWGRARRRELPSLYWEAGVTTGLDPTQTTERWDDPLSRKRWQFQPRLEHHAPLPEEVCTCI
jgi:CRISPR system Cascade subunit CasD